MGYGVCQFCKKRERYGICYDDCCIGGNRFESKAHMDPETFAWEMRCIANSNDPEAAHGDMDDLMCKLLESLGYDEGVEIFKNAKKYYA